MHASQFASHIVNLSLPLIIFLISVLLLIFSLGRHTQKMRNTAVGTRNLSMSVHVSTLVSILSFLVLYLSHYLIIVVIILQNFKLRRLIFLFCILVVGSYPSGHSIILILGNPKLKQNAKKFLLLRKCCQWEKTLIHSKDQQFSKLPGPAMPPSATESSLFINTQNAI